MMRTIGQTKEYKDHEPFKTIIKLHDEVSENLCKLDMEACKVHIKKDGGKLIPEIIVDEKLINEACETISRNMKELHEAYRKLTEVT